MNTYLSRLDYLALAVYLLGIVVVGSLFARRQRSVKDFFLAGRNMPWWAVCLSIFATNLSAISFMGVAGWIVKKDLKYEVGGVLYPLVMLVVVIVFVPVFYRLQIYTVFEYLERRFNTFVRSAGAVLFIIIKSLWLGAVIYIPSLALSHVVGWNLYWCIILVGVFSTLYTYFGGMKAVIWTDVIQFIVLAGGLVLICVNLMGHFNWNVAEMWRIAGQHISTDTGGSSTVWYDLSFNLGTEATVWAILAFYLIGNILAYGTDQVVAQRYFTIGSFKGVVKAVLGNGVVTVIMCAFLSFAGIGLVAYLQANPGLFEGMKRADEIIPHYVVTHLGPGLRGLIIAALFAATMSSVDSGIHSLSTSSIIDFYRRYFHTPYKDDQHYLSVSRYLIIFWGAVATVLGLYIAVIGGKSTILQTIGEVVSYFGGPLGAMFLVGLLSRRANIPGVLIGTAIGVVFAFIIAKDSWMEAIIGTNINWMWRMPFSTIVSFTAAYFCSMLFPAYQRKRSQEIIELTVYAKAKPGIR